MPALEKATQTVPASVSTRSNESAISSRHERGCTTASDLTTSASPSTSERDSPQLRQVRRCFSTAVSSIGGSSPVRRASILVNTDLHCIRHPLLLQRVAQ